LTQVFSTLVNNLTLAHAQLDGKLIETATDALANARRIAFLGVGGGSANIAGEGASRFFQLGIPSEALTEGYLQRMLAATFTEGDVIVAISSTGQPTDLLDSVAIAKQYGAMTISLTKRTQILPSLHQSQYCATASIKKKLMAGGFN
ncbi:MAG: SIS domain-containing protein, partial [Planktomarina sp.]|nr:SIS domain-containing protein [Planktomarina sp.]